MKDFDLEERKNANLMAFLIALTQIILLIFFPVNILSGKTYAAYFKQTANFKNAFFIYFFSF